MGRNRSKALASEAGNLGFRRQSRRTFLTSTATTFVCLVGAPGLIRVARARAPDTVLPQSTVDLLESSPYVYISPLKSDGSESECHGEVWYAWIDGAVVVTVASGRWKARAVKRGLQGTRIWVGDHGRWKGTLSNNESFRKAPVFEARGEVVAEEQVLERLLAAYETKYPKEIGRWRDRMRSGYHDGSRVLLRYRPIEPRKKPANDASGKEGAEAG